MIQNSEASFEHLAADPFQKADERLLRTALSCAECSTDATRMGDTGEDDGHPSERIRHELESLWKNIDFGHIQAVTHDTETRVFFESYLFEDAHIPALSVDVVAKAADSAEAVDDKTVVVDMMSGNSIEIQIAPPYLVKSVKERLEAKLGIPAFLQRIVAEIELEDGDNVSTHLGPEDGSTHLTMIRKDPPCITTEEFLKTIVFCVQNWETTLPECYTWYRFDTYREIPTTKQELFEWAERFKDMKHEPFTETCLQSLDLWLETDDYKGHPEVFAQHISRLQSFLEGHCYSPSWIQVYDEPYGHDDDLEMVMFLAGRLRAAPETLMVGAVRLNCWI
ncbi:unnamed protein product [Durusdinium trenchii]|uniref:Ubiquitin-like domain-containing protein n=1 Tax=Durusdinium trenchii TaxID=1381693 RepID=A0ABP0NEY0_9DINO